MGFDEGGKTASSETGFGRPPIDSHVAQVSQAPPLQGLTMGPERWTGRRYLRYARGDASRANNKPWNRPRLDRKGRPRYPVGSTHGSVDPSQRIWNRTEDSVVSRINRGVAPAEPRRHIPMAMAREAALCASAC
jgi:hypothetical protein